MGTGQLRATAGVRWGRWLAVFALSCGIAGGVGLWQLRSQRNAARVLLARGRYSEARAKLARLLWILPGDSGLRLMIAEAHARDDSQASDSHTRAAVEYLNGIPDTAAEGLEARIREARLQFVLLRQPAQAELRLQRAIRIAPDAIEAWRLMWTILDMTGREDLVEPVFRRLYDLGPASSRTDYLRAWYYSQIEPARVTSGLDEQMGFRSSPAETERRVELHRLLSFREQEPDHAAAHAAVARWFQQEGDLRQALHILEQAPPNAKACPDPYFIAIMVSVLVEVGRLEEAAEAFAQWPPPHAGNDYWKAQGLLQEELQRDYRAAAASYARALAVWPGPTDWKCRFRQAACLALAGEEQHAGEVRRSALLVQKLFTPEAQLRLRQALEAPQEAENLQTIVEYYKALGRDDEIRFWEETNGR